MNTVRTCSEHVLKTCRKNTNLSLQGLHLSLLRWLQGICCTSGPKGHPLKWLKHVKIPFPSCFNMPIAWTCLDNICYGRMIFGPVTFFDIHHILQNRSNSNSFLRFQNFQEQSTIAQTCPTPTWNIFGLQINSHSNSSNPIHT